MPNFDMPHDRKDRIGKLRRVTVINLLFSVLHRTFSMAWAPFSATLADSGIFVVVSARQPESRPVSRAARILHLVGSRLPRPYHFPARIQSFQAVAAPFPGELRSAVRPSRAEVPTGTAYVVKAALAMDAAGAQGAWAEWDMRVPVLNIE